MPHNIELAIGRQLSTFDRRMLKARHRQLGSDDQMLAFALASGARGQEAHDSGFNARIIQEAIDLKWHAIHEEDNE